MPPRTKTKTFKPVSIVLGTALVTSLASGNLTADTDANPFAMKELPGGYMQLASADNAKKDEKDGKADDKKDDHKGKYGEGKCGNKSEKKQSMEALQRKNVCLIYLQIS